jgi:hypothetical protein
VPVVGNVIEQLADTLEIDEGADGGEALVVSLTYAP